MHTHMHTLMRAETPHALTGLVPNEPVLFVDALRNP
eukprot:CAMPEP_0182524864 /NCGR_PEP_ID=MMETSP1323-20130603/2091_1 /TAXON_ID=236787 /ORGANISM="Florenciella parvula, Strain RCC1693" /LENGTH=35 /DNA_ID= /DNA_START= /DNA_END= /DNA_ORIENTATION=